MRKTAFIPCLLLLAGCFDGALKDGIHGIEEVISGDTLRLDSGKTVRMAGIRAPARGEPFFEAARERTDQFVVGRDVEVEFQFVPGPETTGIEAFAMVLVKARALKARVLVNTEILESGLARIDYRSLPKGRESFFEEREDRARREKRGIWSSR
jgi:endonuclease YncB( thermonuclease family)